MNPFKLYRRSQEIQWNWIRKHPFQWIALNAILIVGFIGFIELQDYLWRRKLDKEYEATQTN